MAGRGLYDYGHNGDAQMAMNVWMLSKGNAASVMRGGEATSCERDVASYLRCRMGEKRVGKSWWVRSVRWIMRKR